jgi:hypothetical protein
VTPAATIASKATIQPGAARVVFLPIALRIGRWGEILK